MKQVYRIARMGRPGKGRSRPRMFRPVPPNWRRAPETHAEPDLFKSGGPDYWRVRMAQNKRVRRAGNYETQIAHGGWGKEAQQAYLSAMAQELL